MKPTCLYISPTGGIQAVADERAEAIAATLGSTNRRRASHVLPEQPAKRALFKLLRLIFDERGNVGNWTRGWRGPWIVRFAENPDMTVFRHPSRHVAIAWEIEQLERRFANQ